MKTVYEYVNESFKSSIINFLKKLFKKEDKDNKDNETEENNNRIKIKGSLDNNQIVTLNKDELYNSIKKFSEKNNNNKNLIFILCEMEHADDVERPYVYEYKGIKNNEIIISFVKNYLKDIDNSKNNIDKFIKDLENIKDEEITIDISNRPYSKKPYKFNDSEVVLERLKMTDFVCVLISFWM